jgi:hypothetical protein
MNKDEVFKNRLLELAKLLRKLPKKRFNYTHWVGNDWKGKPDLSCGTTACALGWATTIPSLRKQGLRLLKIQDVFQVTLKGYSGASHLAPEHAAQEIFGLNNNEFEYLFIPDSGIVLPELGLNNEGPVMCASAKEVAKHIREFVKAKYNQAKA